MTRKNPDKRTAKRLKKLEDERQAKKVKICQYRIKGESYRTIGARFGMSHQAIANICNLLLVVVKPARKVIRHGPRGGRITTVPKRNTASRKVSRAFWPRRGQGRDLELRRNVMRSRRPSSRRGRSTVSSARRR